MSHRLNELFREQLHPYTKGVALSDPCCQILGLKRKHIQLERGSPQVSSHHHPDVGSILDVPKPCQNVQESEPELKEYHKDHFVACYLY